MTNLTVRSKTSLYNQQAITRFISNCTKIPFKIKRKGKHCFYITFACHITPNTANLIATKLWLSISYQSDVRCIISDNFDAFMS